MNIPFKYQPISRQFISKLSEMVLDRRESVVLLGSRYGGKRHVMFRIQQHLSQINAYPIVRTKFLGESLVSAEKQARELIYKAVVEAHPGISPDDQSSELLGPVEQLYDLLQKPVVLIAANVDGMAHHVARRFLTNVRVLVESGRLIAVLSGEDDLRDLVYGPNSEFTCANQFVLQGFDEDTFNDQLDRYLNHLPSELNLPPKMRHSLWESTGGSVYLMRMILWSLIEARVRSNGSEAASRGMVNIPTSLKTIGIPGALGAHVFRHATQLISKDPACWDDLEKLLREGTIRIGLEDNPPSRLELAGIAVRDNSKLRFASELMRGFVSRYYDNRRLGDLFAAHGMWEKAFERYALLDPEERMRPSGINDKDEVEATINSLCASLHSQATRGVENVENLFLHGCRYVLGFSDVTFWHGGPEWKLGQLKDIAAGKEVLKDCTPGKEVLNEIARLLPSVNSAGPGLFQMAEPLNRCSAAAILPAIGREQKHAVVVGDLEKRIVMSRERERLVHHLIRHFVDAYSHAINVKKTEIRLDMRNRHIQIINSIFNSLGGEVLNAGEVIKMAARELRRLGYRRVLFCLVDPKGERIQGVLDDSDDKDVDVAQMTNWALSNPTADLQPYVIYTKKPKIVEDASKEPLANMEVVDRAKMKSEALVPLLNPEGDAIGTVHIERSDGTAPRKHEVEDLMVFGRQLAIAIEQSERVNLLQSALDKIPEPVVIVDSLEKMRYANRVAGDLIGVPVGWQGRSKARPLSGPETEEIQRRFREVLMENYRRVYHYKGIGVDPSYRGAILIDSIQNWQGHTIGALLHIEDLNYLYRVFDAFRLISEADDISSAMECMLQAMSKLGPKWGRLYAVDEENPDRLISKLYFGPMNDADREDFVNKRVVLQLHSDPGQRDWYCIDIKAPVVFCWNRGCEDGRVMFTDYGLKVINVNPPVLPKQVRKIPGDFWIDFPLITEEKVLGKMCLQCDSDFRPENFEMLKVLSKGLLDAFLRRERQIKQKERWIQEAADKTVSTTAHTIKSRLATLSSLLAIYRGYEKKVDGIKDENDKFEIRLERIFHATRRMTERLGELSLRPRRFDLVEQMRQTISSVLGEESWVFQHKQPCIEVTADDHLIETALIELLENSRAIVANPKSMKVSVAIEVAASNSSELVEIIYKDNGPGVPLDLKERIFDPFFSSRPGQEKSTGLGLRFVRRVAEIHGGDVREIGKFGEGAEFVMHIPGPISHT